MTQHKKFTQIVYLNTKDRKCDYKLIEERGSRKFLCNLNIYWTYLSRNKCYWHARFNTIYNTQITFTSFMWQMEKRRTHSTLKDSKSSKTNVYSN